MGGKKLRPKPGYLFRNHTRVVKKLVLKILNTRKDKERVAEYRDLLHYAGQVVNYALAAIDELRMFQGDPFGDTLRAHALVDKLERTVGILRKVNDQTERRVLKGEKFPASKKIVSFFEEHNDSIVKGSR